VLTIVDGSLQGFPSSVVRSSFQIRAAVVEPAATNCHVGFAVVNVDSHWAAGRSACAACTPTGGSAAASSWTRR
jgi:hypothetical protein